MRFKFILAIALILCAFCVLPVNAYEIVNPQDNSVYNIGSASTLEITFNNDFWVIRGYSINGGSIIQDIHETPYTYQFSLSSNTSSVTYKFYLFNQQISNFELDFTVNYNYEEPAPSPMELYCYIDKQVDTITDNSVTYRLQCLPSEISTPDYDSLILYSEISSIPIDNIDDVLINLVSYQTTKYITVGQNGYTVYAAAGDLLGSDRVLLSVYLNGTGENPILPEPTVDPSALPDSNNQIWKPSDIGISESDSKRFQIRNIEYANDGGQINGANLTIWYTDINDAFSELPIYKNTNSPAIIDLTVPIAGGLFVEYGNFPYYEPVKVQNYPYLNNRRGFWITQELSDYYNLYYVYFDPLNPSTDIKYGITIRDGESHLPVSNAAISMDGGPVQYTTNYGGTVFNNVSQGKHSFTITKNGYSSLTVTKDIQISMSTELELFPLSAIPTATITPAPVRPVTPSPTLSSIDKPSNIMESVSFGFAKIFGIKTVENANYIFALMLILFPAVVAGSITHQALGFIAGGMIGFVFALAVGLVPIWVFFAMCLLAVIYFVLKGGNEGF